MILEFGEVPEAKSRESLEIKVRNYTGNEVWSRKTRGLDTFRLVLGEFGTPLVKQVNVQ